MDEEVIWEGKIKLLRIKDENGDESIFWNDEEFDTEELAHALKVLKHEWGERKINAVHIALVGILEELKMDTILIEF